MNLNLNTSKGRSCFRAQIETAMQTIDKNNIGRKTKTHMCLEVWSLSQAKISKKAKSR